MLKTFFVISLSGLILNGCSSGGGLAGLGGSGGSAGGFDTTDRKSVEAAYIEARSVNSDAVDNDFVFDGSATTKSASKEKTIAPVLTLRGDAVVSANNSELPQIDHMALYLNKPKYSNGKMVATLADSSTEEYQIVAFEKNGENNSNPFEYIYVLSGPYGELSYLVVVGSKFGKPSRRALEASMLIPKPGVPGQWSGVISFDLGKSYPIKSEYILAIEKVEQALSNSEDKLDNLEDALDKIADVKSDIKSQEKDISEKKAENQKNADERDKDQEMTAEVRQNEAKADTTELDKLEIQLAILLANLDKADRNYKDIEQETKNQLLAIYPMRNAVAEDYANFIQSGLFTWSTKNQQDDFQEEWEEVLDLDEDLAEQIMIYEKLVGPDGDLNDAVTATESVIGKYNNSSPDPREPNPWLVKVMEPVEEPSVIEKEDVEEEAIEAPIVDAVTVTPLPETDSIDATVDEITDGTTQTTGDAVTTE